MTANNADTEEASTDSRDNDRDDGEVFCTSCGALIKREAKFCPECGVQQEEAATGSDVGGTTGSVDTDMNENIRLLVFLVVRTMLASIWLAGATVMAATIIGIPVAIIMVFKTKQIFLLDHPADIIEDVKEEIDMRRSGDDREQ